MFFILVWLFFDGHYRTSAAPVVSPFADPLAYDAPLFTRDECPNDCSFPGRSVFDIVWSCLATTFAVTWVSVHPNIPRLEEKNWPIRKRRIFLMCMALLAPEVMIMWAFKQWRGAVKIRETMNKARPESCVQWTMTHAHFLQMGGFKLNYKKDEINILAQYRYETKKKGIVVQESVLRFDDLQYLLENQLIDFPDTKAKEIEDRSKGDALSKGVALLQITWFIIQLIARAHQRLTITEIELTTAALAGLNSIMYLFWRSKPLDVRCPIVIRTKELERQFVNARNGENKSGNEAGSGEDTHAQSMSVETWTFTKDEFQLRNYLRESLFRVAQAIISAQATHLLRHQTKKDVDPVIESQSSTDGSVDSLPLTRLDFRRAIKSVWRTGMLVITKLFYLPYLLMFLPMHQIFEPDVRIEFSTNPFRDAKVKMHSKPALQLLFDEHDMRWIMSMMFYSEYAETRPLLIFSALAGAAFGSIHCAAWHFDFPSPVERIFWRTASLSIVGVCLYIVVDIPTRKFLRDKLSRADLDGKDYLFWYIVRRVLDTIPAIVYPLSRLSLLILALISLRDLPDPAFKTVTWTKFIPHV